MRAIVKQQRVYGGTALVDAPKPGIKAGYVLIKVMASAVCGSDLHAYEYLPGYEFIRVPVVLGHEYSGVVEAIGEGVTGFQPGERVMGESNQFCGRCSNCRQGKTHICMNSLMTGLHSDGAMAEYMLARAETVHRIPDDLSFAEAAVAQPASVSAHAVFDQSGIRPGDVVAVFGPGIVGQIAAQAAVVAGAGKVVLIGTAADAASRLPVAEATGLQTICATEGDLGEELIKRVGVPKVDLAIECSGATAAAGSALNSVRRGGTVLLVGIYSSPATISLTQLVRSEVWLRTSYTSTWSNYETVLRLLSQGRLRVRPFIKEYTMEAWEDAFQDALQKKVFKPVFMPEGLGGA